MITNILTNPKLIVKKSNIPKSKQRGDKLVKLLLLLLLLLLLVLVLLLPSSLLL